MTQALPDAGRARHRKRGTDHCRRGSRPCGSAANASACSVGSRDLAHQRQVQRRISQLRAVSDARWVTWPARDPTRVGLHGRRHARRAARLGPALLEQRDQIQAVRIAQVQQGRAAVFCQRGADEPIAVEIGRGPTPPRPAALRGAERQRSLAGRALLDHGGTPRRAASAERSKSARGQRRMKINIRERHRHGQFAVFPIVFPLQHQVPSRRRSKACARPSGPSCA